jgi:putative ABC transport system permease protein
VVPAAKRDPRDESPHSIITISASGEYSPRSRLYVRTTGSASALRNAVRSVIRELDPVVPTPAIATLGESVAEVTAGAAQIGLGAGAMGVVALMLASLGLFAVLAFIVEQRRYEIGVRIALGAESRTVTRMILRQSLGLSGVGIAVGAVVAVAAVTLMRNMLYGLPPIDPVAFIGSTTLLFVIALFASAIPARRAARVDPMVVLKSE